jgi:hypothetical protein
MIRRRIDASAGVVQLVGQCYGSEPPTIDEIAESHHKGATKANGESLFLDETGRQWLKQYAPGKLRAKRIELYAKMEGARTL